MDERLERGEIDEAEADHVRNSILERELRDQLDKKIKEAIDGGRGGPRGRHGADRR